MQSKPSNDSPDSFIRESTPIRALWPLDRLGLDRDDAHRLDTTVMLPQVGQGALAVECRFDDSLADLVAEIEHAPTRWAVDGERAFLAELGGDCDLPAAAHAIVDGVDIALTGFLATAADPYTESGTDPEAIGRSVARHLAAS